MGDLMDDGDDDLLAQVIDILGEVDEVVSIDEDIVGHLEPSDPPLPDRCALIEAEQVPVAVLRPVLDEQGDIVQLFGHPGRQQIQGFAEDRIELLFTQSLHASHSNGPDPLAEAVARNVEMRRFRRVTEDTSFRFAFRESGGISLTSLPTGNPRTTWAPIV